MRKRLPSQRWSHDGKRYSVSLYVEGDKVVGMTPVKVVIPKGCKGCSRARAK